MFSVAQTEERGQEAVGTAGTVLRLLFATVARMQSSEPITGYACIYNMMFLLVHDCVIIQFQLSGCACYACIYIHRECFYLYI